MIKEFMRKAESPRLGHDFSLFETVEQALSTLTLASGNRNDRRFLSLSVVEKTLRPTIWAASRRTRACLRQEGIGTAVRQSPNTLFDASSIH